MRKLAEPKAAKKHFVFNAATGRNVPVYDCHFCEDQRFIALPQEGAEWDAKSCFIEGMGASIPCPKCVPGPLPYLSQSQGDYLGCYEAMKNRQKQHDTTRFRAGELSPILRKLDAHFLLRKQPELATSVAKAGTPDEVFEEEEEEAE